jgi:hypothetical protein
LLDDRRYAQRVIGRHVLRQVRIEAAGHDDADARTGEQGCDAVGVR